MGSDEPRLHQAIMDDGEKFPSQLAERFQVRLPDGMRDKLRSAAEDNNRSMNAEIVARLEASFNEEGLFTAEELHAFVDGSMIGMLGAIENFVILEGYDLSKIVKNMKTNATERLKDNNYNDCILDRLNKQLKVTK